MSVVTALPPGYQHYQRRKFIVVLMLGVFIIPALVLALSMGPANLSAWDVIQTLLGQSNQPRHDIIIWNIRMPQAVAALIAGAGLAVSGAAMQSILRNPLGSPFTLGISNAAAFGAAFSIMMFDVVRSGAQDVQGIEALRPYLTTAMAFVFSLAASIVILLMARVRGATAEIMVLTGIALGALFAAGTMFLQFFADDVQLAAIVFWTFGDTSRANWQEIGLMTAVTLVCTFYFMTQSWNYNAIDAGDETAQGLGVRVQLTRVVGMLVASLLTAVAISFLGIIGFVGLVVPHMVRRLIGSDHRYLMVACFFGGGLLLLLADTAARLIVAPHVLPVSVLTAFMGAPAFIWLILRGKD